MVSGALIKVRPDVKLKGKLLWISYDVQYFSGFVRLINIFFFAYVLLMVLCLRNWDGLQECQDCECGKTDGGRCFCSGCVVPRSVAEMGLVYIYFLLYLGCCLTLGGFQGRQEARKLYSTRCYSVSLNEHISSSRNHDTTPDY